MQAIVLILSIVFAINGFITYVNRSFRYYPSPQNAHQEIFREYPLLIVEGEKTAFVIGSEESN